MNRPKRWWVTVLGVFVIVIVGSLPAVVAWIESIPLGILLALLTAMLLIIAAWAYFDIRGRRTTGSSTEH